jgi:HKD family nuclease
MDDHQGGPSSSCKPPALMTLVQNNQEQNHLTLLSELIAQSEATVLCSGWVKVDGLKLLLEAIDVAIQRGAQITLHSDQENTKSGVREALELRPGVRHCIATKRPLHAKLYYFERAGRYTALVGSGNITEGGLRKNEELSVQLTGEIGDQQQIQIAAYLARLAQLYAPAGPDPTATATGLDELVGLYAAGSMTWAELTSSKGLAY